MSLVEKKIVSTDTIISFFKNHSGDPGVINDLLLAKDSAPIVQKTRYNNILSRPNISIEDISKVDQALSNFLVGYDRDSVLQAEILMKYEVYIEREREKADKLK